MNPEELLFAKTHEWVSVAEEDGAKVATVGISAFAVEQLTDLVFMDLPEVGRTVAAGEKEVCEIESVKAVSDLYPPVSGEIIAVNSELPDNLEWFTEDAFGKSWILKIKMTDDAELGALMNHADYQKLCEEEA